MRARARTRVRAAVEAIRPQSALGHNQFAVDSEKPLHWGDPIRRARPVYTLALFLSATLWPGDFT